MLYIDRAIKDGYASISTDERGRKITYKISNNHIERYDSSEEQVRAEVWAELIYNYSYPANRVKIEVTVPDRLPTDRADIVVFSDDDCKRPYAVVECKRDGVTDAEFNQAIEQGVGNATWVKLRADYVLIVAGTTRRVLDVSDKYGAMERESNILADLPKAYGKPQEFRFQKGDKDNDIQPVSRETLIATISKCHNTLWGGGRLSPPTAFGELCKLIFVKISDEQKARRVGEPYQFQIKTHEPSPTLAKRINDLYDEQKQRDPEVFSESIKVDARVLRTVVSHLQSVNLSKTDLDVKGVAFELFMDSFFKGDFGQYFTPRPIIEFAIAIMKPTQDSYVLDTSCGSGGFLLYAMDYIRRQAEEYDYTPGTDVYFRYWHDFASNRLFGIEINDEIARVAKMNMIVHDDGHTNVINCDALDSIEDMHIHNAGFTKSKFDFIFTNPPFGSKISASERPYLGKYTLGNTYDKKGKAKIRNAQNSEVLFIERIYEFLKSNTGRAAVVLPDGILTNNSMKYVRDYILEKFQLLAVVSLPQVAFAHFGAGVKASIIFVRKRGANEIPNDNEAIFMAAPEEIGYDATGRQNDHSQLPAVVLNFELFMHGDFSFISDTGEAHLGTIIERETLKTDNTLSAEYYHPERLAIIRSLESDSNVTIRKLDDIVHFMRDTANPAESGKLYLGLAGVISNTGELSGVEEEAEGQAFLYRAGDVLYARLRPYLNKVLYAETDGVCSTEFHVMRVKTPDVLPEYLAAIMRSNVIVRQTKHMMTGNTHPRISNEAVRNLRLPIPSKDVQSQLVADMRKAIERTRELKREAETEWVAAKLRFERELLGGTSI